MMAPVTAGISPGTPPGGPTGRTSDQQRAPGPSSTVPPPLARRNTGTPSASQAARFTFNAARFARPSTTQGAGRSQIRSAPGPPV